MSLNFWTAPNLSALSSVAHGFSHRTGGMSEAPFDSLNLGLHVGDAADAVRENRSRVAAMFGTRLNRMICAEQVHGGVVAVVSSADAGRGTAVFEDAIPGVDALVTAELGLLLTLFFADCVPVFFADARRSVVAIAHAGWRGLVANILENTLDTMRTQFGTTPDDVRVAVGPCIGKTYFEVGAEVATHFPENTIFLALLDSKPHVDLEAATYHRLLGVGVLASNIILSGECTVANPHHYFSHRRDAKRTGRMGGFITLRP